MSGFTFRARHLQDNRLYECYVAAQTGEVVDPRAAEHLADCAECRARYGELGAFIGGLREEADAEVDAAYSAEALRLQQTQIARRIEHTGHAARVISFPKHQPIVSTGVHLVAPRWLAAAAAAGLVVGVGVGSFFQGTPFAHRRAASAIAAAPAGSAQTAHAVSTAAAPEAAPAAVDPSSASDEASDAFLDELEFALERPRTSELQALDELTPHVREIRYNTFR